MASGCVRPNWATVNMIRSPGLVAVIDLFEPRQIGYTSRTAVPVFLPPFSAFHVIAPEAFAHSAKVFFRYSCRRRP